MPGHPDLVFETRESSTPQPQRKLIVPVVSPVAISFVVAVAMIISVPIVMPIPMVAVVLVLSVVVPLNLPALCYDDA